EDHKLRLHHRRRLVVMSLALSQKGIDLVDEDDARLNFDGQGEDSCRQLLRLAVPLVGERRYVQIDEAAEAQTVSGRLQGGGVWRHTGHQPPWQWPWPPSSCPHRVARTAALLSAARAAS